MGYKKEFPWETLDQAIDEHLAPVNVTASDLRQKFEGIEVSAKTGQSSGEGLKFKTPSGKIEFSSPTLLVKGSRDHVASKNGVLSFIDSPINEAMEAMGGTGDTLTGIVSALIASGMETTNAATTAARINRLAGHYACPTPASQVTEIIAHIPRAMKEILYNRKQQTAE